VSEPDFNRLLRLFAWLRLGVAEILLVVAPLLPAHLAPAANTGMLATALLVGVVSSGAILVLGPLGQPRRTAWLVSLLDVVLVTAIVAATGGPRSIYSFLYVLSVTAACVLLPRVGALAMAAVGSLLYTGLVFVRTIVPYTLFESAHETTALEVLTMFLNAATFLTVAIVAGGLGEQYRTTQQELDAERRNLRDLEAFKTVILNSVGTGLFMLDCNHTVTALNRAAERITGIGGEGAIGRSWAALFGPSVPRPEVDEAIDQHPMASARHDGLLERPDGTRVPVRMTFSALRSGDGRQLGFIGVCEDLSEIREMENRMRQADRLATVGRLAANLAHEIRNPLGSLTAAIEALTSSSAGGEDRDRLSQIVARESARLDAILADFLEYARPAPLVRDVVDVVEVIDEVLLLLEHRDLPPGLKIVREYPAALRWRLDAQQFRQAFWNLCLNAIEAMPDGGELGIAAAVENGRLEVTVADTGHGILPADLPHIFEPFYSTKAGGSGLGLALVHRIVRDHGGDVAVRSTPGGGATFTLRFGGDG
jgi:two-component system sensor histidine kinase PilS (NtrC family)